MMRSHALAMSAVLFLSAACGDDTEHDGTGQDPANGDDAGTPGDGADGELGDAIVDKFNECKVRPTQSETDNPIEDDYDRCAAKCVVDGSCDDLRDLACGAGPSASNTLLACVGRCTLEPTDGYACSDGAKIAHAALCDGFEDCSDSADEEDCPEHVCKDGEIVTPAEITCDGFEDCTDGSDEAGCPDLCS